MTVARKKSLGACRFRLSIGMTTVTGHEVIDYLLTVNTDYARFHERMEPPHDPGAKGMREISALEYQKKTEKSLDNKRSWQMTGK